MTAAYIGLDLGTTGIKAVAFDGDDNELAIAEVPTPLHAVATGGEYDANEIWDSAAAVLRTVTGVLEEAGHEPVAIAVASMAESGVLIDAAGQPLAPVIAWFDERTDTQSQWWTEHVGIERTQNIAGLTPKPVFGANKMRWVLDNLPEAWDAGHRWLNFADWAAYKLSGVMSTDYSMASRTMLLDVANRCWSDELLTAAEIDGNLLAPLVQSGHRLGVVTSEAARATGLPAGAVVGAGGQDHICAALALGVTEPGTVLDSIGTAEALFLVTDGFDSAGLISGAGVNQGIHVEPGRTYAMTGLLGGGRIDQRRQELGLDWADFIDTAEARVAMDELAEDGQSRIEVMLRSAGVVGTRQLITGGGSRLDHLIERKRALSDRPVQVADQMQAAALGAAKLARRASAA